MLASLAFRLGTAVKAMRWLAKRSDGPIDVIAQGFNRRTISSWEDGAEVSRDCRTYFSRITFESALRASFWIQD